MHAIRDPGRRKILQKKKFSEWREMLNDPMTNMLFLYNKITFFTWKHSKMADGYLPIFSVTKKYFHPFKTHTWFSSIFQTLVEIQRNVILYEWAQSKLSYRTGQSFGGWGFQYIHKTHTGYFLCKMFRLRIIPDLEYIPDKWLFLFPKCMHPVNQSHRFIFTWTDQL